MCTDVERKDKSRICKPGSVRVNGCRQIEMYSHLIHTVDHAVGYLTFKGDLNTGLVLRTIQLKDSIAEVRVGATVLYDSS